MVTADKKSGSVSADSVLSEIRPHTCLVSIILANNETGIIQVGKKHDEGKERTARPHFYILFQPISDIGKRIASHNDKLRTESTDDVFRVLFHSDAAQAIGKIPISVKDLNVDYLTIVGHKVSVKKV